MYTIYNTNFWLSSNALNKTTSFLKPIPPMTIFMDFQTCVLEQIIFYILPTCHRSQAEGPILKLSYSKISEIRSKECHYVKIFVNINSTVIKISSNILQNLHCNNKVEHKI